jgi:hypothetical protein
MDRRMVNADAAFGHHFLQIPQAQAVGGISPQTWQDHGSIEVTAFKHDVFSRNGGSFMPDPNYRKVCNRARRSKVGFFNSLSEAVYAPCCPLLVMRAYFSNSWTSFRRGRSL